MKKIDGYTLARLVNLTLALINAALVMFDKSPLPFVEEDVEEFVMLLWLVFSSCLAYWYNNNHTENAQKAQEFKKQLDQGEVDFKGPKVVQEESEINVDNTDNPNEGLGGGRVD